MTQIGIIGTGAWASTLGILLARDEKKTVLWSRTEARAQELTSARVNERSVPGVEFPELMTVSASLEESLGASDLVIIAVPSVTIRENIRKVRSAIPSG
ncbi:MAG: NAD(P)-binding domain-containing protein, partial [Chloroflexi bacterium]|nr:NAD(P)-binding domain-containing protein [Chloroflexota bacterium]